MVDAPSGTDARTGARYPLHTQNPKWTDNYIKTAVEDLGKMVIPKYATASARDTAIAVPAEGDMCWLQDTNVLQVYTGATWTQIYPAVLPTFTTSTSDPTGGVNGDIHFKIV